MKNKNLLYSVRIIQRNALLLLVLFFGYCATGVRDDKNTPSYTLLNIETDQMVTLTNQKFTVYRYLKNQSKSGLIKQMLYVNGNYHSSLICELRGGQDCLGGFLLSFEYPGKYKIKIVTDPSFQGRQMDKEKYKDELEVTVHDNETFLKDCLHVLESVSQVNGKYKNHEITREEFQATVKHLAEYTDYLGKLTFRLSPRKGLRKFDHYMALAVKKLSVGLWALWVVLVDDEKDFYIIQNSESKKVPVRDFHTESSERNFTEARTDLLVALNILMQTYNH